MYRLLVTSAVGIVCGTVWAVAEEPAPAPAAVWVRPEIRALRVPDGAIRVDGDAADWAAFGQAFAEAGVSAPLPANLQYPNADLGSWHGPDDLSFTAWVAADSANVYVLAQVHDQLLFNDADPKDAWLGDDFELFIDANPPAAQFAPKPNENSRQFIFVPAWVNPVQPAALVWKADENPGVKMASHLRPGGYTIEVQIPKALFPNWKAHPDLNTVGFDVMLGDADSPGPDGPHGVIKYSGFLLSPGNHFSNLEKLGRLTIDPKVTDASAAAAPAKDPILRAASDLPARKEAVRERLAREVAAVGDTPQYKPADIALAQQILDHIADKTILPAAEPLSNGQSAAQKALLRVLAKRLDLPAPTEALVKLCAPTPDGAYLPAEIANYALMALSERGKLPVKDWFDFYNRAPDPQIRLTWVWCCRLGDKAVGPELQNLLTDKNLRIRIKAAMALGVRGDPAALPALEKMKAGDPHMYGQRAADAAIQAIEKRAEAGK